MDNLSLSANTGMAYKKRPMSSVQGYAKKRTALRWFPHNGNFWKKPALTYAYYQRELKPKPAQAEPERRIVGWRCRICGFVYDGPELPADYLCPLCGHPAEDFEPIYAE